MTGRDPAFAASPSSPCGSRPDGLQSGVGFTPGPWEVHQGNGIVRKCEGGVCQVIADMRAPYKHGVGLVRGEQQQWSNARLIAAAPELYEALRALQLQALQSNVNDPANEYGEEALNMARAALAKARGEA